MDNSSSHQKCTKPKMDPYHDTCYNQNNATAICDISFNSASNYNMLYHQSGTFTDKSVKTNVADPKPIGNYIDKPRYKAIRKWKRLGKERSISNAEDLFLMRVLSFNILAQNLLEDHSYLYMNHNKKTLMWKIRKPLVIQEIIEAEANVICLQEMQEDHLLDFIIPFKQLGYDYLYKKRTNDKKDGLLLLYRSDQFTLVDYAKVELYQSGIELLSRDNVGIIAKFSLKDSPETQFVVATTHLLYNPKRNDVRLAQIQLLLAEIERIAFVENLTMDKAKYLPIILTGDFNLKPFSGVYKFLTEGSFEYHGKGRNLEPSSYRSLSNSLIPSRLCVTDNCQHFNILTQRLQREGTGKVMLENSEFPPQKDEKMSTSCNTKVLQQNNVNADTDRAQTIEIIQGHSAKFASGTLTHPFNMRSVYTHTSAHGEEATTHQEEWVTVDYIFYSNIQPIEKYTLLTVSQCKTLRRLPNFVVGSDHLSIGATFQLPKKKSLL
ncbi:protein angel isoform X2 [Linepithema humile]|nr:PREDICTED: protein angel isoform X2 [Linepithema humile]XP_012222017.1 PREDICTED: protein angel isoform X2 [Linepithema humile]XP_012222026.1 PREDICTED: protein angel isoform X2 [Linepithema humile]XP_012222036.1 PREDICTED: protein angel isoform X2 [Linepithema humile]XP_012222044.1 PREDICTED: protein angel isoform X2 [Linepithema humile]XP_012222055.1 PREDICTED: protein angel isoform X2 [Linepithema humile]